MRSIKIPQKQEIMDKFSDTVLGAIAHFLLAVLYLFQLKFSHLQKLFSHPLAEFHISLTHLWSSNGTFEELVKTNETVTIEDEIDENE